MMSKTKKTILVILALLILPCFSQAKVKYHSFLEKQFKIKYDSKVWKKSDGATYLKLKYKADPKKVNLKIKEVSLSQKGQKNLKKLNIAKFIKQYNSKVKKQFSSLNPIYQSASTYKIKNKSYKIILMKYALSPGELNVYYITNKTAYHQFSTICKKTDCISTNADFNKIVQSFRILKVVEATAPSSITLEVGSTSPVGGVTNVSIPVAGGTDTTGAVTGWFPSYNDNIKFTVTDNGGLSTITINGASYTSGTNYVIVAATPLTIIVTTTETGKTTVIRTFTVSVTALVLNIGDIFQGGKVAYLDGLGHGLIAATSDQSTGVAWGCDGTDIPGASGTAIGTGIQNTIDIMNGCSTAGIPARIADAYEAGGYSDWYLPSKDELNQLYTNKIAIGGFTTNYYWSSSESTANYVWGQSFNSGFQAAYTKNETDYVRAVRSF